MLQVSMLGRVAFLVDGAWVKTDLGQSGRLLACYLLEFPDQTHRRERLADLFWPNFDAERARSALNTAIWRIRKLLALDGSGRDGRQLVTMGNDVVLKRVPSVSIDTHVLEGAIRRTTSPIHLEEHEGAQLRQAIAGYGGPFLDGDHDDWILQEREKLHCLYVRGLVELMRYSARCNEIEEALEYGRRILAVDTLRESIQRDVMLLLVLNGQRAEAIHVFQRLKTLLKQELGIAPMPETTGLMDEIVTGRIFGRLEELKQIHFSAQALLTNE